MGAWPGEQLEAHVGPGGEGASGWPHPFPLAPKQLLCARYPWQLCQAPRAPRPSSPSAATRHPCPRPGFHRLLWRLSVSLPTRPGQLPGASGASPEVPGRCAR